MEEQRVGANNKKPEKSDGKDKKTDPKDAAKMDAKTDAKADVKVDAAASSGATATAEAPVIEKKKKTRRPIWVCIPDSFEEVSLTNEAGEPFVTLKPKNFKIIRCDSKKDVYKTLTRHQVDAVNSEHVLMFRATALPLKLSQQLIVRF